MTFLEERSISAYRENNINSIIEFSKIFGDRIAVGFSGGPDSLKTLLLAKKYFKSVVAIIENDIYSPTEFIFNILRDLNVSFVLFKPEIKLLTHNKDRAYRMNKFSEICINLNIKILWLGHNLEDYLGTFYLRLERQSSWWGLSSIAPITLLNTVYICRPILYFQKNEILDSLKEFPIYHCSENNVIDEKHRRNAINNKIEYSSFFSIYKMGIERADITQYAEEFCNKHFKIQYGYGELDYKIFDLNEFLIEKVLSICSNYIYPNMISDFLSRFKLKINFNLGGIFFQFTKKCIYLFRERKEQKFGNSEFFFDKRWITNYQFITEANLDFVPKRANATIPYSANIENYQYILPSFVSYFNINYIFNKKK